MTDDREIQEYNGDRSYNGLHPEVGTSVNESPHSVKLNPDMVHHNNHIESYSFPPI